MSVRNSILILLSVAGYTLAGGPASAPGDGTDHGAAMEIALPGDHGAYFAPAMRFDAQAGSLEVTFGIEEAARLSLIAFDSRGKLLAILLDGNQGPGFHHLSLFSNRLQGYQGHVVFQLRNGPSVLAETRTRAL